MNLHTATLASGFDRQTCETINLFAARLSQKYHIIMFGYHGLTEVSLAHLSWRWTKYTSTANRSAHDLSSPELAFSKAAYLTTLFTSSGICHLARTQTLIPILFPSGTTQKSINVSVFIYLPCVCPQNLTPILAWRSGCTLPYDGSTLLGRYCRSLDLRLSQSRPIPCSMLVSINDDIPCSSGI